MYHSKKPPTGCSTVAYNLDLSYDMLSQLTAATNDNVNSSNWSGDYNYKENGDMGYMTVTGTSQTSFTYTGNQMATATASKAALSCG